MSKNGYKEIVTKAFQSNITSITEENNDVFVYNNFVIKLGGNGSKTPRTKMNKPVLPILKQERDGAILAQVVGGQNTCYKPKLVQDFDIKHPISGGRHNYALVYPYLDGIPYDTAIKSLENLEISDEALGKIHTNFYRYLLISAIIGNGDAHGKNALVNLATGNVIAIDTEKNIIKFSAIDMEAITSPLLLGSLYGIASNHVDDAFIPCARKRQRMGEDLQNNIATNKHMLENYGLEKYASSLEKRAEKLTQAIGNSQHSINPPAHNW